MPKVLTLDIETKPGKAYVWRMFKENIAPVQLIEPHDILCVGTKWKGSNKVNMYTEWSTGHREMLSQVLDEINEADAIITYNGERFDLKHLMTAFIKAGLPAPAPVTHIDLYKFIRNKTQFMSKRLDFVAQELGIGAKMQHSGFQLWIDVMNGNATAQKKMEMYCAQDVRLTEKLYEKLKGYIPNHPSLGFATPEGCPTCGSARTQRRGLYHTRVYEWQRHQCTACGSWFKTTQRKKVSSGAAR